MTLPLTPAPGDYYRAPWGRYVVHRCDGEQVILRDASRATAYVMPSPASFAANYKAEAQEQATATVTVTCNLPMMHSFGLCACSKRHEAT